jgi:hypothetical protein
MNTPLSVSLVWDDQLTVSGFGVPSMTVVRPIRSGQYHQRERVKALDLLEFV